ncbi:hypothetical protein SERLADRAFT_350999 [Serpula lacrymans var. lacrymans S7.9]|uniref:Uncharacterized protein n=1 Tax=Serpula lacrymans var. lacrymans (strain S7.9) TaxID=578457 RepID=F8P506_SERL9|nr:uncharacterized protein SERLADRAFT_350999 [Serpula lacrymans var. lacrymans S7.9]EGO21693.1 hypothetical protein SERLADRAFT_350999 [Serpula lacrymans var. lacrymans S7.9]
MEVRGLKNVIWETDEEGHYYALCAYVHVPAATLTLPGLEEGTVPVFPAPTTFKYKINEMLHSISRKQLPMLPAFVFTDYKVQGHSLLNIIVDLASATCLQNVYVMLSRATSLESIGILHWFSSHDVYKQLSGELREEFAHLEDLDIITALEFESEFDYLGATLPVMNEA